ncbi:DUF4302 domain-containing protein [Labilibaculum euxinus]
MRKIILFISILSIAFSSCEKEDVEEIFDKSPEERVTEQLNTVRADLMSNEMGWHSTYTYNEGKETLLLLLKFIDDTRVEITVPERGNYKKEAGYSLRYTQQIDLIFETHSFLADLVDKGRKADFRWELEKQEDGQYFFKSRAASNEGESELNMMKATPENLKIAFMKSYMRTDETKSFFRNLELTSGEKYGYSCIDNKVTFKYIEKEKVVIFESEVNMNNDGFVLTTPFVIDGKSISEFEYDSTTGNFSIINADGVDGGINYDVAPAFTVKGVVDQFLDINFKSIIDYSTNLQVAIPVLQDSVPNFNSFQLYSDWGYLLCYAPGTEGGNWAGFSKMNFTKTDEDLLTIGWEGYVYGNWWKKIYYNDGGQLILNFLLDENGLYVIQAGKKEYYLVSKSNPSYYCLVEL